MADYEVPANIPPIPEFNFGSFEHRHRVDVATPLLDQEAAVAAGYLHPVLAVARLAIDQEASIELHLLDARGRYPDPQYGFMVVSREAEIERRRLVLQGRRPGSGQYGHWDLPARGPSDIRNYASYDTTLGSPLGARYVYHGDILPF